jgi:hypothetical protein
LVAEQPQDDLSELTHADLLELINLDQWSGGPLLRNQLPTFPHIEALPSASVEWRGKVAIVRGDGATTNDRVYLCRLLSTGSYEWTAWL